MNLYKLLFILLLFFFQHVAFAQLAERQLVLVLPDTLLTKLEHTFFNIDTNGDYCYYPWSRAGPVITNTQTYGPFKKQRETFQVVIFQDADGSDRYLKGKKSTAVCGPYNGDINVAPTLNRNGYFAYTVSTADGVGYFIHGKRVATTDSLPHARFWCTFSDNGRVLYTTTKGPWNYLFLNGKLIDSSKSDYDGLEVDDENNYRYAIGAHDGYNHAFRPYPHDKQKVFGTVAAHGSVYAKYDDTTYFYGNGEGKAYLLADDSAYKDPKGYREIVGPGKGNNFLSYMLNRRQGYMWAVTDSVTWMNVNGKVLTLPYAEIFAPCMDQEGNYAFFGLRDYHLYKNISGVEQEQPLSKHGVRATPVSIDTKGNSICYYKTDDSVYLYENDRIVNKCAATQFELLTKNFLGPPIEQYGTPEGLCADGTCYLVYRNTLSPAMLKPTTGFHHSTDSFRTGDMVYHGYNEYGYWLLQKAGDGKYDLLVNNRRVALPVEVDFSTPMWYQLAENYVLTEKFFIFYAKEGSNIYRYKITL